MSTARTINFEIGHKFGKENQIEVIELYSKTESGRTRRVCKVKCSICENDSELHGNATYEMSVYDVKREHQPCGCCRNPKWTESQWTIILRRKAIQKNYFFFGFNEPWQNQDSRIILFCPVHKKMWTPTIGNFMQGRNCPACGLDTKSKKKSKPTEVMISNFTRTGAFKEGTVFWKKSNRGRTWCYTCPICSNDEYVQAGICTGIFESDKSNLQVGKLRCRCAYNHKWSQADREFQVNKILKENSLPYTFVGWDSDEGYKDQSNKFILCDEFGVEYTKSISGFIDQSQWHPSSRDNDPNRKAFLYVIDCKNRVGEFTGYGVTANLQNRFKEHRKQLDKYGFYIDEIIIFESTWKNVFTIEQSILHKFPRNPQDVVGFKKEATFYEEFGDVVNFAEIALQQDGQRVELKYLLE